MRSFGRALAASVALAIGAFGAGAAAQTADAMYADLVKGETELRRALDLAPQLRTQPPGEASTALLERVRTTVAAYESLVRRFPRSGHSDNALWQAAVLAADAFWQFGDSRDRTAALRLFALLKSEYPSSSFVSRIAGQTTRLNGAATPAALSTLKAIRREVLPDALRITLELEREAMFSEERLDGPSRIFVDLQNTQAIEGLKDATIPFPDDVVRQARIGRQPDNHTRVAFDLQGAARYSVYSLYNPYRVVIDFERDAALQNKMTLAAKSAQGAKQTAAARAAPTLDTLAAPTGQGAVAPASGSAIAPMSAAPPSSPALNAGGGFSLSRQLGLGISRIVIDPGHGGHDPGAQVRGLNEAELVLDVALRLEKLLSKETGVEAVLTRRNNSYVALGERTAIANRSGADLFLSIHANGSANVSARGFETYFLNFAPNPEAEALAARENAGSSKTMGNLPDIVKAIALNNKIDESRDFATMVQASMADLLRKADRNARNLGIKQAPFMVLIGATMPSVLAEVSFLTNRDEAALLRTQSYRQRIAEALFEGVMKYQQSLKKPAKMASQ